MMRIPAVIGVMSAALVFLTTNEQHSERVKDRAYVAVAAQKAANREFVAKRNAEINASMAMTRTARLAEFAEARRAEINASLAAVEAERESHWFAAVRNAEINASMAAVEMRQLAEFTKARNQEIANSIAAIDAQHRFAEFAAARNAEITASLAAVDGVQMAQFAQARNAEIAGSMIAVASQHKLQEFADAQNAEAARSLETVHGLRLAEFAAARNDEIRTAMRASDLHRAYMTAMTKPAKLAKRIETGSIEAKPGIEMRGVLPAGTATLGAQACQAMINELGPIYWARETAALSAKTRARLDELASIAKRCTSMVIEVHGHSDAKGSPDASKRLSEQRAQAVAAYLIRAGVEADRVTAVGHGAEAPIVSGDAQESMACNRRIEFSMQRTEGGPKLSEILQTLR